jgi:hypothetical protein
MVNIYMANLQNHITNKHVNYMSGIGQKVKHLAELGAKVKGAYDTAKTIYSLAQVAAPYVMPLLGAI